MTEIRPGGPGRHSCSSCIFSLSRKGGFVRYKPLDHGDIGDDRQTNGCRSGRDCESRDDSNQRESAGMFARVNLILMKAIIGGSIQIEDDGKPLSRFLERVSWFELTVGRSGTRDE